MLDFNKIIEHFLNEAVARQINDCEKQDQIVINAVNDNIMNHEVRVEELTLWMNKYTDLKYYKEEIRNEIIETIILFADRRSNCFISTDKNKIISEFRCLKRDVIDSITCEEFKANRKMTSWLSKALWCCFPDSVPLYDSHAERALWILSRLTQMPAPNYRTGDCDDYLDFISVWLSFYESITIFDNYLFDYPYKVRVFDKILWIIGQPDYGHVPYQPSATENRLYRARTA